MSRSLTIYSISFGRAKIYGRSYRGIFVEALHPGAFSDNMALSTAIILKATFFHHTLSFEMLIDSPQNFMHSSIYGLRGLVAAVVTGYLHALRRKYRRLAPCQLCRNFSYLIEISRRSSLSEQSRPLSINQSIILVLKYFIWEMNVMLLPYTPWVNAS